MEKACFYRAPCKTSRRKLQHELALCDMGACMTASQSSLSRSSKSSSSHPPFRLCTVTFSASCCCSLTASRIDLSCASLTFCRNCPLRASMIRRLSTSSARDALTRRMRPMRSAASGSRICERMDARASASRLLREGVSLSVFERIIYCSSLLCVLFLLLLVSAAATAAAATRASL